MFKKLTLIAAFSTVVFIRLFAQTEVNISYIANEGYIIEDGELKIACDVFFDHIDGNWCESPSEDMISQMRKSAGIFKGIDLITVSHKHIDHFDCDILTDHMLSNKKAILICPEQVKALLVETDSFSKIKERVRALNLNELVDTTLILQNISVNTLRLEHSPFIEEDSITGEKKNRHQGIQNFAYMFNTKNLKFFHSGDANPLNKNEFYTFFPIL